MSHPNFIFLCSFLFYILLFYSMLFYIYNVSHPNFYIPVFFFLFYILLFHSILFYSIFIICPILIFTFLCSFLFYTSLCLIKMFTFFCTFSSVWFYRMYCVIVIHELSCLNVKAKPVMILLKKNASHIFSFHSCLSCSLSPWEPWRTSRGTVALQRWVHVYTLIQINSHISRPPRHNAL